MEHTQNFKLNNDFRTCLYNLRENGMLSYPRGTVTREILNYNITLTDPRNRVITFPDRKTNPKYLLGEFIWYLSAENTVDAILPYAKFWDGIKSAEGTINSNYGHRIFGEHDELRVPMTYPQKMLGNRSQWDAVIACLSSDKDSRQAVMNIHMPFDRYPENKDVPCTLSLQWFIREDKLNLIVNMRSNDLILGFTNDVFQFTMLQECMMLQLRKVYPELELGHYFHNAGSMHVYERHFSMAQQIIDDRDTNEITMVPMDVFNEETVSLLVLVEREWQRNGAPDDFDFDALSTFKSLSPYWQTLVKAFFTSSTEHLSKIFFSGNR